MAQAADRTVTPLRPPMAPRKPVLSTSAEKEAHAALIATLAASPPSTIRGHADATDLKDVADELKGVFGAFAVYLTARLDALGHITAADVWCVDDKQMEAAYRGFLDEVVGGLKKTSEKQAAYETWRAE